MKRILLILSLTSLVLVTSSSFAFFGKPRYSFAYQVAQAGKINEGLSDMKEEKIREALNIDEGTPILSGTLAVGYATNVFDAPIGPNSLASAAFLLDLFKDRSKDFQYTQILAWMPRDLAKDKYEAKKKLNDLVISAVKEATPESYELVGPAPMNELFDHKFKLRVLRIDGPGCESKSCSFGVDSLRDGKGYAPKLSKSPDFISTTRDKRWFFGDRKLSLSQDVIYKREADIDPKSIFTYEFYQKVSMKLPEWAFVYVAPDEFKPVPAIFHQGDMHLFIKPKKDE